MSCYLEEYLFHEARSELYTPPLIPIGFLLDSYIPHAFPVHSTHSYVFPGVPVESQYIPSTFLFKVLGISNTPLLAGRGAVTTNFKWNKINKKTPHKCEGCCLLLTVVAGCAYIVVNVWGGISHPPVPISCCSCALAHCNHPTSSCLWQWCGVLVVPFPVVPAQLHTITTPWAVACGGVSPASGGDAPMLLLLSVVVCT